MLIVKYTVYVLLPLIVIGFDTVLLVLSFYIYVIVALNVVPYTTGDDILIVPVPVPIILDPQLYIPDVALVLISIDPVVVKLTRYWDNYAVPNEVNDANDIDQFDVGCVTVPFAADCVIYILFWYFVLSVWSNVNVAILEVVDEFMLYVKFILYTVSSYLINDTSVIHELLSDIETENVLVAVSDIKLPDLSTKPI